MFAYSALQQLSGKDTNQLSQHTPKGATWKHYKALRLTAVKMIFSMIC